MRLIEWDDTGLSPTEAGWIDKAYRAYSQRVFAICLRFSAGDRDWALDRMQEVFLKLAERIGDVREEDPGGWLYRVAVNTCYTTLRRSGRWRTVVRTLLGVTKRSAASPLPRVQARRDLHALETALRVLPPNQRATMTLLYLEHKSQNEIASLLGLSKGQVSKLRKRALETLEKMDWDTRDE